MSVSVITAGSNTVNLVSLPSVMPGFRSVQFSFTDVVGSVSYPFSGQTQTQEWPGADMWSGMMEFPPLQQQELDGVKAFLMQCRGIKNGFMLGDPLKTAPAGSFNVSSSYLPKVSTVAGAGAQVLQTNGWPVSQNGLLLPGDYFQLGYRLHVNLDYLNTDSGGNGTLNIWPAVRESAAVGLALTLANPQGLFRRAQNKQGWSADVTRYSTLSFPVMEYR